jgi:hypothetical protein
MFRLNKLNCVAMSAVLVLAASVVVIAQDSQPASSATTVASQVSFAPWENNSTQPPPVIPANVLPPLTPQPGDGETEALYRAAIGWFQQAIENADKLVPAAEMTADGLLNGGHIYVTGSRGLAQEYFGRAGGLSYTLLTEYAAEKLTKDDTLLVIMPTPRDQNPYGYDFFSLSHGWGHNPGTVVHIASHNWTYIKRIESTVAAGHKPARLFMIDDSAPEGSNWSDVSLGQMAAAATTWAYMGEVFAAASRKGKTLSTLGSDKEPNDDQWDKMCELLRTNDRFPVTPIPAGKIARDYYRICQKQLIDFLASGEAKQVRLAGRRLAETLQAGNSCFVVAGGHIHPRAAIIPLQFSRLVMIGRSWELDSKIYQPGDMLLYVGYLDYPQKDIDAAIAAQASVISISVADGATDDKHTHINSHFANWDSVINVAGLPVRILPSSGVIQTPQWYALMAEALKVYESGNGSGKPAQTPAATTKPADVGGAVEN